MQSPLLYTTISAYYFTAYKGPSCKASGLNNPYCLHYIKYLSKELSLVYRELVGSTKCIYYTILYKDYNPVLDSIIELVNALLTTTTTYDLLYRDDDSTETAALKEELVILQNDFTKRAKVTVYLAHKAESKTPIEISLALLISSYCIKALLGKLLDITYTTVSSLFPVSLLVQG